MKANAHQYTIRNVSPRVDRAIKKKAAARGLSLNAYLVALLESDAGVTPSTRRFDDLDWIIGTWVDDPAVDAALAEQRTVDPREWE